MKKKIIPIIIALIVIIILGFLKISNLMEDFSFKVGVVTVNTLDVKSEAGDEYTSLGNLYRGQLVEIIEENENGWYKIDYEGNFGYISKDYIRISKEHSISNLKEKIKDNFIYEEESTDKSEKIKLDGFLFIGDSFTVRIKDTINSNVSNAQIKAVKGVMSSYWVSNFNQLPDDSTVSGVCLLIGVNGFNLSNNADNTKQLIDMLLEKYPSKKIFVQRVFPLGRHYEGLSEGHITSYNKKIEDYNAEIKSYCATKDNVKFIDTTNGFVDADGFLINCDNDGLHIEKEYSQMFFDNIELEISGGSPVQNFIMKIYRKFK